MTSATVRVRGDQIQPGDVYVYGNGKTRTVASVTRTKERTARGATVTWIHVTFTDGPGGPCAPHSKHHVRRSH